MVFLILLSIISTAFILDLIKRLLYRSQFDSVTDCNLLPLKFVWMSSEPSKLLSLKLQAEKEEKRISDFEKSVALKKAKSKKQRRIRLEVKRQRVKVHSWKEQPYHSRPEKSTSSKTNCEAFRFFMRVSLAINSIIRWASKLLSLLWRAQVDEPVKTGLPQPAAHSVKANMS